jgi:succinate-semialdehyde dehydrogenase/glutarate-semialdehyde dehydrogenase
MASNVGVLKHASNVPGCAIAIEEVFRKQAYLKNILNFVN